MSDLDVYVAFWGTYEGPHFLESPQSGVAVKELALSYQKMGYIPSSMVYGLWSLALSSLAAAQK